MKGAAEMAWTVAQFEKLQEVVQRVTYPGLRFGLRPQCNYPLVFGVFSMEEVDIRVECPEGVCNVTGAIEPWNGRWWRLSPHMVPQEIVQTMFKAVLTALEHEAREQFLYKGVSVFDPHYDLDQLVELRKAPGGGLQERPSHG